MNQTLGGPLVRALRARAGTDLRLTEYPVKPIKHTGCQLTGLSISRVYILKGPRYNYSW